MWGHGLSADEIFRLLRKAIRTLMRVPIELKETAIVNSPEIAVICNRITIDYRLL